MVLVSSVNHGKYKDPLQKRRFFQRLLNAKVYKVESQFLKVSDLVVEFKASNTSQLVFVFAVSENVKFLFSFMSLYLTA